MTKILLALLAVSMVLPVSAMADNTTVYGQFRYSVASVESDSKIGTAGKDGIVAQDNISLLGVKGSYGDDIKAFFHLQTQANADNAGGTAFKQRFFFGGLKSDSLGTLKYGRLTNAYKMPGFKMDPLYNTSHIGATGLYGTGGATYGLSPATNGFTDNSIEYHSSKIADSITFNIGVYVDDSNEDEHATGAGVTYSANGITAGVQFIGNGEDDPTDPEVVNLVPGVVNDGDAMRVHASYKGEGYSVGFSYEKVDQTVTIPIWGTVEAEPVYIFLTGTFALTEATDLVATIGSVDDESVSEGTGFTLSIFHDLTTNTKVFASYASVDLDDPLDGAGVGFADYVEDSPSALSFGVQHKFSISN